VTAARKAQPRKKRAPRACTFNLRLSEAEREALEAFAVREGAPMASAIRRVVLQAAGLPGEEDPAPATASEVLTVRMTPDDVARLDALVRQAEGRVPGFLVGRGDVIRALVRQGLRWDGTP
jgi:hypothetical protein